MEREWERGKGDTLEYLFSSTTLTIITLVTKVRGPEKHMIAICSAER